MASERNAEFGLANRLLGVSSSATYKWFITLLCKQSHVLPLTLPESRTKMRPESMIVFRRCLNRNVSKELHNKSSSRYSRDGEDSRVLELRAANDILNSLIRLKVDRGCGWKSRLNEDKFHSYYQRELIHLRPKPTVLFCGAKRGRNILAASAQRKATSHLL